LLGPSSRLVADSSFGQASRSVALVGEARFTVRHDARRPFVVRSGGARVEDLGTVFLVRESTEGVRVAVTEGRVRLQRGESGAEAVDLDAGDAGTMSATGIVKYPRGAVEGDTTWASRRLVYVDAPLADVARDLQRWTGIQLAIDSAVAAKRFSGSVGTSSGAEAVSVLALTLGAQVSWRGDTATLVRARR
jgi:transmembrane sensor